MNALNTLGTPFNFLSCGLLGQANIKKVEKEDVLGINVQNILGQIPIYNFFVGIGRINKSVTHLNTFKDVGEYLTDSDKVEIRKAKLHLARGVVEFVPGMGLIFLVPDIFYSLIKLIMHCLKSKKSKGIESNQSPAFGDLKKIQRALENNYQRWRCNSDYSQESYLKSKAELKDLISKYIKKMKECDAHIEKPQDSDTKKRLTINLTQLKEYKIAGKWSPPSNEEDIDSFLDQKSVIISD